MTSKRQLKPRARTARDLVADLRMRHKSGKELAANFPVTDEGRSGQSPPVRAKYAARGEQKFVRLAAKEGVPPTELFSRRRFAVLYKTADLKRLCARQTPEGKPLSWALVKWILRVEDADQREQLEKTAAEESWTADDLRAELRLRAGTPRNAGRPVRKPKSADAGLVTVVTEANRLIKLLQAYVTDEDSALSTSKIPRSNEARRQRSAAAKVAAEVLRRTRADVSKAIDKLEQLKADLA